MKTIKEFIIKHKFLIISFFYLSISFAFVLLHEPWRDEAQQWLIVRDLDLIGIIKQLKYEGHFLLWYLLLFPIVKLGLPFIAQNVLSWLISGIGGILFLKKAPFKFWKKALFLFTPIMIYYFPAISRCYCLVPLAICLVYLTFQSRDKHPLRYLLSLVFLINIHTFLLVPVGLLFLEYYFELLKEFISKKKNGIIPSKWLATHLRNMFIILLLLILTGLPLFGSLGANKSFVDDLTLGEATINLMVGIPLSITKGILNNSNIGNFPYILLMNALIILMFTSYSLNKKFSIFTIITCVSFSFLSVKTIGVNLQKISLLIFVIILYFSLYKNDFSNKGFKYFKNICLGLIIANIITSPVQIYNEMFFDYSDGINLANFINDLSKDVDGIILVTGNQREMVSTAIPFLKENVKVYDLQFNDFTTFTTWDEHVLNTVTTKDIMEIKENLPDYSNYDFYYVYATKKNRHISDIKQVTELWFKNEITIVKKFDDSFGCQENYWLFKINT